MTDAKEQALAREFPGLFEGLRYGLAVGDGWEPLVRRLCEAAAAEPGGPSFAQVKEKFGGLRVYWNNATDKLWAAAQLAEDESLKVCEACGAVEGVSTAGPGWIKTLCGVCRETWNKRPVPALDAGPTEIIGGIKG